MDVVLTGVGVNDNINAQVDPTHYAIRTSTRPLEWQGTGVIGGHYSVDAITGTIAAGITANSQVFQVRWADPSKLFILKKLTAVAGTNLAFTTLFGADLELIVGHGSTASGSGGTSIQPTSISNRLRTTMAASAFVTSGEIRVSATAALTAATGQTLEPAGIAVSPGAPFLINTMGPVVNLFEQRDTGAHPLVLNTGDTLAVRTPNPGATGTWKAWFSMEWVEAISY